MRLWARRARPSVLFGGCLVTNGLVRAMTYRKYRALLASLGGLALMLAANEASARGGFTSAHSISRPALAHAFRHHRTNNIGAFWPGVGDDCCGPSNGGPLVDVAQPTSGNIHYTYTNDVPWDWAHRYPPIVTPSDRPYVSSCGAQNVTVPGRYGEEQTVSIMRCY